MEGDCTVCVAKTKALISCVVTAQLICVFVLAYAKSQFSHDTAHISLGKRYCNFSKFCTKLCIKQIA